ncbi:PHD-zinc-finger like domain-containing protein, partial [Vararia minispora EC-137]
MGRSATSPHQDLPTVSFVTVPGDYLKINGTSDTQARSYGFNDGNDWERPDHYVRYIEPLESELATQVEYDMDEQDQEWLDSVNTERKANQQNKVSYDIFEVIMDRLEKGWFDLTKNIQKPDMAMPSEDTTCAICDDSEVENTNAIVFCDGCNLAVHQDCYGVPYIPEGQWLCRKCTVSPENPVSCLLCPNEGGAFKQNAVGEWVHLLCAIWIPETRVANEIFMEPITGTERISKQRWRLRCSICDVRQGACIQCTKSSCFLAFHVTCARKEKLLMPMKASAGLEPPPLQCFCEKHLPRERVRIREEALAAEAAAAASLERDPKAAKAARAYAKGYKPGPPIVPSILIRRIERYIEKVQIRKAVEFVELTARYWSLKREARRGAPLLKRLHLEPWTASAGGKMQTDEEKVKKLELMKQLRADLERVKQLVDQVRQREAVKRDRMQALHGIVSEIVFPHANRMRLALERIWGYDKQDVFKNPVSRTDVPDYYDVIKHPMCWAIIDARLDGHQYWDIEHFKADVLLVFDNAMKYNASGSPIHKLAHRLKNLALPVLSDLDKLRTSAPPASDPVSLSNASTPLASSTLLTPPQELPVGDLEPPFPLLSLFTSASIADESAILLTSNPLDSLFSYEFPVDKPKPPPQPKSKKRKDRRYTSAPREDALDASPGFRAPAQPSQSTASRDSHASNADGGIFATPSAGPSSEAGPSGLSEEPKRRRSKLALPGQNMSIVPDVSSHDSFKMFDTGWILPDTERRGGRKAIDRRPNPPALRR